MGSILVIDDDVGVRETFSIGLGHAGHTVVLAASGQEGTQLGSEHRPDVAVIDLRLPDIVGTEVLRALRTSSPRTAVVMITGFGSEAAAAEALRLGAKDWLNKPVDLDDLVAVVTRLLPSSSLQRFDLVQHAALRCVNMMLRVVDSPSDPRTVSAWARLLAASPGAVRNWCRTAGLKPKAVLKLTRVIRANSIAATGSSLANLLDVADLRTVDALKRLGAPRSSPRFEFPMDPGELLMRQRWVDDCVVLDLLHRMLTKRLDTANPIETNSTEPHRVVVEAPSSRCRDK